MTIPQNKDRKASEVNPEMRVRMGDALAALGRTIGLTNEEFEIFDRVRNKTPAEPLKFEGS
jgi:plasmid stability protein